MKTIKQLVRISTVGVIMVALALNTVSSVMAQPKGAQRFEVYDDTQDGLQVATDPDIGNVVAEANPGGQARLILEVHVQKAAPNTTYTVELVQDSAASNGGLNTLGHSGGVQVLGTLTTNGQGNGNAHFDLDPSGDGNPDTVVYGHIDIEDYSGTAVEADGSPVVSNEYGAAPNPALGTPMTWME